MYVCVYISLSLYTHTNMHTHLCCSVTEVNTRATLTPETHIYYFPS